MLPCQPAKKVLEVVGKNNTREGIFETNGRARFGDGIRMGHLYDFGFDVVRKYVSSFWIPWDGDEGDMVSKEDGGRTERDREEEKLTMFAHHSYFKSGPGMPPDVGDEFRSEAYEELVISLREEKRSMWWHGGFSRPPADGWKLR
jgi:hypothetical protein